MITFTVVIRWVLWQLTPPREGSAECQTGEVEFGDCVAEDDHGHDLSFTRNECRGTRGGIRFHFANVPR